MDTITKTKADTYLITKTTTESISLKDLETKIKGINDFNASIQALEKEKELLPESIKKYVILPGEIPIQESELELFAKLKELNGKVI